MKSRLLVSLVLAAVCVLVGGIAVYVWLHDFRFRELETEKWTSSSHDSRYVGSLSCRRCHERFYKLWSTSHHGKAMQPVTPEMVAAELTPADGPIQIGALSFTVDLQRREIIEKGAGGEKSYPMVHALGGKNVFFFLTPLERGRLQVMPLVYDVRRKAWFDTTHSMVRHFGDVNDEAIDWHDPLLTFNTACYNCHVSQLDKNYHAASDSYETTWREPGINCETCHGPCGGHVQVCEAAPAGTVPKSLRLLRWRSLTTNQVNDSCSPCHAKMRSITASFNPGERFFDHFDLTCLEDRDFYPDGRDLGENYTLTGWLMNPCVKAGSLDCVRCHTSSGRFRFKDNPNASCLPCHAMRVAKASAHSHHPDKPGAPTCVSCHMPTTEFSRMRRSDHSMRPPSPDAAIRFGSPLACLLCHTNQTPQWAKAAVDSWHPSSRWQPRIVREGDLVDAARKGQWNRLPDILGYLAEPGADPVVVTSLIRVLANCPDPRKWESVRNATRHESPLVRGAAVDSLRDDLGTPASRAAILAALGDDYRVVRVHAASALSRVPRESLDPEPRKRLLAAEAELLASFEAQPDAWGSHYNIGNYRADRGDPQGALAAYDRSIALRGDVPQPYVNASVVASQLGRLPDSIRYLQAAYTNMPRHPAVNLNLGLALAENGQGAEAEKHLRVALAAAETKAQAAYNLAVLVGSSKPAEAAALCEAADAAEPSNPRNAYTQAYYLKAAGQADRAADVLRKLIERQKAYADAWFLLGDCYAELKQEDGLKAHFRAMAEEAQLPENARAAARQRLAALSGAASR